MDSSPPGSSVCGIFQARVLEWVALEQIPSPRDLPDPGIEPMSPASPALAGRFFTTEPPGKPSCSYIDSISPSGVNFIAVESGLLCPPNLPGQKVAAGRLGEGWVTALIFRAVLKLYLVRFLHPSLGLCSRSQAKPRGLWVPKKHSPASLTQTDVCPDILHRYAHSGNFSLTCKGHISLLLSDLLIWCCHCYHHPTSPRSWFMWQRTGTLIKDLPVSKSPHSLIQLVSVWTEDTPVDKADSVCPVWGSQSRDSVTRQQGRVHKMTSVMSGEGHEGCWGGTWLQIEKWAKVFTEWAEVCIGVLAGMHFLVLESRISARADYLVFQIAKKKKEKEKTTIHLCISHFRSHESKILKW